MQAVGQVDVESSVGNWRGRRSTSWAQVMRDRLTAVSTAAAGPQGDTSGTWRPIVLANLAQAVVISTSNLLPPGPRGAQVSLPCISTPPPASVHAPPAPGASRMLATVLASMGSAPFVV